MPCIATGSLETQEPPLQERSVCQCLVRPLYPMGGSNFVYNLAALKYYITSHLLDEYISVRWSQFLGSKEQDDRAPAALEDRG